MPDDITARRWALLKEARSLRRASGDDKLQRILLEAVATEEWWLWVPTLFDEARLATKLPISYIREAYPGGAP